MLIYMPTIDGTGSTFTTQLLGELFKPNWYCHLDAEPYIYPRMERGENLMVATGFHESDEMVGPYVPIAKAEEWMLKADRIVCSIRRPLYVLRTAATMGRRYQDVVKSFLLYAKWHGQFDIFFMPVDIDKDFALPGKKLVKKRMAALNNLMDFLGLPRNPEVQARWAEEWPVHNGSDQFRPVKEVSEEAMGFLLEHKGVLAPFLESVGYRKLWAS